MKTGLYVEDDGSCAAAEIAAGTIAIQPFGNILFNRVANKCRHRGEGQPDDRAGSLVTTWRHLPSVHDWKRLPEGLDSEAVIGIIDVLLDIGSFGFRGPAAAHILDHLALRDGAVRTTRLVAPGFARRTNRLLTATMQAAGERFLAVSPATRSEGDNAEEPAHYRAEGVIADFEGESGVLVVQHRDEAAAQARYAMHAPLSATILAFHKLGAPDAAGRPTLIVERHGSSTSTPSRRSSSAGASAWSSHRRHSGASPSAVRDPCPARLGTPPAGRAPPVLSAPGKPPRRQATTAGVFR